MIQRIQTLFLICAALTNSFLFGIPVANLSIPNNPLYIFYTTKVIQSGNPETFIAYNWTSLILNVLTVLLPLVIIFMYKKRFVQLRFCIVNIILQAGLVFLAWFQIHQRSSELAAEWFVKTGLILPVIGIIFTWLAIRGIIKDITLLKSLDRIR